MAYAVPAGERGCGSSGQGVSQAHHSLFDVKGVALLLHLLGRIYAIQRRLSRTLESAAAVLQLEDQARPAPFSYFRIRPPAGSCAAAARAALACASNVAGSNFGTAASGTAS